MATLAAVLLGVWVVCAGFLVADPMNRDQALVFDLALTAIVVVAVMVFERVRLLVRAE